MYSQHTITRMKTFMNEINTFIMNKQQSSADYFRQIGESGAVAEVILPSAAPVVSDRIQQMDSHLEELITKLNTEQRKVYDIVTMRLQTQHSSSSDEERLSAGGAILLTGPGGSGKSYVIKALELYCNLHQTQSGMTVRESAPLFGPIAKMAYTGVAAFAIGGSTLHRGLSIPMDTVDEKYVVSAEVQRNLARNMLPVRLLVIDEFSFIGTALFFIISQHIRSSRLRDTDVLDRLSVSSAVGSAIRNAANWGGMVVLFCGDPFQLRPVLAKSLTLYPNLNTVQSLNINAIDRLGLNLWHCIDTVIILDRPQRQSSDHDFAQLLNRIRLGNLHPDDIKTLELRRCRDISPLVQSFPDIVQVYGTNRQVTQANMERMRLLSPLYISWARHSISEANLRIKAVSNYFDSKEFRHAALSYNNPKKRTQLHDAAVMLVVGARVSLCYNLSVEVGLVNGAIGTVYDIIPFNYSNNNELEISQQLSVTSKDVAAEQNLRPFIVLVQFDEAYYSNDAPSLLDEIKRVVPIMSTASHYSFLLHIPSKRIRVTREQIPLRLSYAMTVHKTQGLTFSSILIDLASASRFPGGVYVALSRVRRLKDVHIIGARISLKCFIPNKTLLEEYDRLIALSQTTTQRYSNIDSVQINNSRQTQLPPLLQSWPQE